MLSNIDPLLTGELLLHLDAMGHGDTVVLADAHFPASALAKRLVVIPGVGTPELLRAICTVVPLDDAAPFQLMAGADGQVLDVQRELVAAAGAPDEETEYVERHRFYEVASGAYLIVRTGEQRVYANAILSKGVVRAS